MIYAAFAFAILAGAAGALAYGYRGQRDQEREQITYLRKQLEARPTPPAPNVQHHPRAIEGR